MATEEPSAAADSRNRSHLAPMDLLNAVIEIDRHVAHDGWDQPALLFALVPTDQIRSSSPHLAAKLRLTPDAPALTTFEQAPPPADVPLDEFLAGISWPEQVRAAAVVVERIVVPPTVEAELATAPDPVAAARQHPAREEVRLIVAADRDGHRMCALRLRSQDTPDAVRTGPDLVPALADALAATFG
jgi:hypothetical protein